MKKPGEIAFTRTPRVAHSAASARVTASTPCLLIVYGVESGIPRCADSEAMLMIAPEPRASMWRPTSVQAKNTLVRLVSMTVANSDRVKSSAGLSIVMPCEFTRMSMSPASAACATTRFTSSGRVTSAQNDRGARAGTAKRLDGLLDIGRGAADDGDLGADVVEAKRDLAADAVRPAEHQRGLAGQREARFETAHAMLPAMPVSPVPHGRSGSISPNVGRCGPAGQSCV